MRIFFYIIYILAFLVSILSAVMIKPREREVGRKIRGLLAFGSLAAIFFCVSFCVKDEIISLIAYSFFLAFVEWELFYMFLFVSGFTRVLRIPFPVFMGMIGINVVSIFSFIVNIMNGKMFEMVPLPRYADDFMTFSYLAPTFYLHVGICAAYTLGSVVMLVMKAIESPMFYKKKYICVSVIIVALVALDNVIIFSKFLAGFNGLIYALAAFFIANYMLVYEKTRIMGDMLSATVDDMPSAILCFDNDGNCIYNNREAKKIFHLGNENPYELMEYLSSRFPNLDYERTEDNSRTDTFEIDGENHYFESEYKKLKDKHGNFIGFYLHLSDRTKNITDLKTEQYKASHDNLTAIYNAEGFATKVKQLLEEEPNVPRVIVCSNIKDFKMINELFGSKVADGVLVNIARQLIKNCSGTDSVPARLENDRFALCMRKDRYSDELFNDVAQRAVRVPGNEYYKVLCHIGVYSITDPSLPVSEMCEKAILAMEQIKGNVKNRVAHYNAEISDKLKKEQEIVNELKNAINNKEFTFYIQPIVDADGNSKGGEALARWVRPKKGVVPPASFIPVFERTGFITVLDKYIWEKACEVLRQWQNIGIMDKYLSVNISPRDFFYVDVYNTLTLLVQKYGIEPANLKLEITESAIMSDVDSRVALIKKLREFGFSVAMDDYGKEHYSLSSLKDIPLDAVKIDMKCLKDSENDSKSKEILKSVLDLAKQLDFKTITMGVETEEQLNSLTEMGTDLYQGYYFAKPMSVDDFEQEYMGMSAEDGTEFNDLINNATAALEEDANRIAAEFTAEQETAAEETAEEAEEAAAEEPAAEETPKE